MFILGFLLLPLGILIFSLSERITELKLDYTDCRIGKPVHDSITSYRYSYDSSKQNCTIEFQLKTEIMGPLYLYYQLDNYHQNYRKYVSSISYPQLEGNASTIKQLWACNPLINDSSKIYYPCGSIAANMFLDSIDLSIYNASRSSVAYSFDQDDIALPSDKKRYDTPGYLSGETIIPQSWRSKFQVKDTETSDRVLLKQISQDPHFHVWMRVSPFPNFRKLYGIGKSNESLSPGSYRISVKDWSDIGKYQARKSIVITNLSFLGSKNNTLSFAYIIMGLIFILTAIFFLVIQTIYPREIGDYNYLSWNQEKKEADKATQLLYKIFSTADD